MTSNPNLNNGTLNWIDIMSQVMFLGCKFSRVKSYFDPHDATLLDESTSGGCTESNVDSFARFVNEMRQIECCDSNDNTDVAIEFESGVPVGYTTRDNYATITKRITINSRYGVLGNHAIERIDDDAQKDDTNTSSDYEHQHSYQFSTRVTTPISVREESVTLFNPMTTHQLSDLLNLGSIVLPRVLYSLHTSQK